RRRDELDSTRKESPLRPADDARVIDSSDLTLEEVIDSVIALVDEARGAGEDQGAGEDGAPKEQEGSAGAERAGTPRETSERGAGEPAGDSTSAEASRPAEGSSSSASHASNAPSPAVEGASEKPKRKSRAGAPRGKLHAFRGNTFDDYYDHDMRDFPLPARIFLGFVICIAGLFTKILWPWRFEQGELLWNEKRGRVIVMNHVSMLEPVAIVCSLWFHGQRCRPIYKSEFDKMTIATWLFSRAGGIPVQRGTADLKAVRRAQWALQRGENVLIYPEGTRIKSDDQPVEIHGGFALIAQMGKAPVQPAAVVGARDITRPGKILKRLGRVFLKAGECIEFSDLGVKGRKQQAQAMEKVAMERVYELRDELRRDHPGKM
ncbi:MAG: 1-acyl-sn-glycerol-3-phosphate acyltransferase, partial [Olsenella sp.]|nr:1-acyl-sn-glycerol-3-phosphate acyltransferase [Olsenella sp.]